MTLKLTFLQLTRVVPPIIGSWHIYRTPVCYHRIFPHVYDFTKVTFRACVKRFLPLPFNPDFKKTHQAEVVLKLITCKHTNIQSFFSSW